MLYTIQKVLPTYKVGSRDADASKKLLSFLLNIYDNTVKKCSRHQDDNISVCLEQTSSQVLDT